MTQEGISAPPARLVSLDVFRGATIASMLLVNNPGTWEAVYPPLRHADWHGWTLTDLVFPFFLWIVGVSITLSLARRSAAGDARLRLVRHALRRAAILFALGLFLSGFPIYHPTYLRIPGVLQRIAVCYLAATLVFLYFKTLGRIAWTFGFMAVYWVLMMYVPVPGYGAGVLEKIGNFAQYVDSRLLRGHMWGVEAVWDPEGIVSTLPAIATTLFGVLAGELLAGSLSRSWKCLWLLAGGSLAVAAGLGLQPWMPINKSLWTVPFALLTAGLAAWCFAICYWVAEVRGWRWWTQPFVVFGMNPIALYVLAGLAARSLNILSVPGPGGSKMPLKEFIFRHTFAPLAEPANASLIFGLCFVLVFYGIGLVMYRKRWFIKV